MNERTFGRGHGSSPVTHVYVDGRLRRIEELDLAEALATVRRLASEKDELLDQVNELKGQRRRLMRQADRATRLMRRAEDDHA
jgi:hypothetical protein